MPQRVDDAGILEIHQQVFTTVLVAHLAHELRVVGRGDRRVERADEGFRLRAGEGVDLGVQIGAWHPAAVEAQVAAETLAQASDDAVVGVAAARADLDDDANPHAPALGRDQRIGQFGIAQVIGRPGDLAARRRGLHARQEQVAQHARRFVQAAEMDRRGRPLQVRQHRRRRCVVVHMLPPSVMARAQRPPPSRPSAAQILRVFGSTGKPSCGVGRR